VTIGVCRQLQSRQCVCATLARGWGCTGESAFIPLKFALGEAFQFDWSEESLLIGGLHCKLCASRAFLLIAYPTQSHEMVIDAHAQAIRVFGGILKRGI